MRKIKLLATMLLAMMATSIYAQTETVTIDGDHGKLQGVILKPELKAGQ